MIINGTRTATNTTAMHSSKSNTLSDLSTSTPPIEVNNLLANPYSGLKMLTGKLTWPYAWCNTIKISIIKRDTLAIIDVDSFHYWHNWVHSIYCSQHTIHILYRNSFATVTATENKTVLGIIMIMNLKVHSVLQT